MPGSAELKLGSYFLQARRSQQLFVSATHLRQNPSSMGSFISPLTYKNEPLIPGSTVRQEMLYCSSARLLFTEGRPDLFNGVPAFTDNFSTETIQCNILPSGLLMFVQPDRPVTMQLEYRSNENVFFGFYEDMIVSFTILVQ